MKNYTEKHRDISRSVLPSTARKAARDNKANRTRRIRRQANLRLHEWAEVDNAFDYEGFMPDEARFGGWDDCIAGIVEQRRNHDKLSVVQWAERTTVQKLRHLDDEERYQYFKKILPDNTIGRHALGHIADKIHPFRDGDRFLRNPDYYERGKDGLWHWKGRQNTYEDTRARRAEKLHDIFITPDAHKRFNNVLKRSHTKVHYVDRWYSYATGPNRAPKDPVTCEFCTPNVRTFYGEHDIEDWLDYAVRASGGSWKTSHPYYLTVLDKFRVDI